MDAGHERAGATFELVSQWRRPFYYPKSGEGKMGRGQSRNRGRAE